jgi:hypothetical protein
MFFALRNSEARVRRGAAPLAAVGFLLAALLLPAAEAWTQPAKSDTTEISDAVPERDWLPHGSYQTTYNVNRTVQTWTQVFNTPYTLGRLQLNTNVSYSYTTDSNNDRKTVGRMARTSFNYLPLEGLKLGMSFDVTRNNMETPTANASTKTDRDKVLVTGEYDFSPLERMNTAISAKTGAVDELLENRTVERSGVGRNTSLDINNSYQPWRSLVWNIRVGGDLTSLDSKDSITGLETKDRNTSESYKTSFNFTPGPKWSANLALNRVESQFQYPKKEAQETKSGFSNSGNLRVNVKPLKRMNIDVTGRTNHQVIDFALERTRSTLTKTKALNSNLNYEMFGAKIEGRMNWENQRNEYGSGPDVDISVLSQAGYLYVRSLAGSVSRALTGKLEAKASGSISLRSYQFDDTENNLDDRDLQNQDISLDLTYTPSGKYRAGLGVSKRIDRLVYVSSEKSSNNREGETYTVQANLSYTMSATTSISQNTRMSADYSFYEFSETRDALIRSTSLHTVFRTRLMSKIGLALVHDYRYQDQGGVTREGGTVYYGKTGNNDRHDMTIKLNYEPVDGVKLTVSQRFQEDKRFSIDDDVRTLTDERERVELKGKMEVNYRIGENTTLDGKFERTESTVEGKIWRITASFRRNF